MERNYIGVDLHKAFFQVCAVSATGAREWEARFPRTAEGIADFRRRCGAVSQVAVEASGPTWSFVDAIQPSGATIVVVDPRKTKLKAGFAAKTDRLDARRLADAVRRDSVVSIYVPPLEIRALRDLCRGRHQLVRLRTRTAQMIRALLLRSGLADVPVRRVYSVKGLDWLTELEVPAVETEATLDHLRHVLEVIQIEASQAETAVRQRARADTIAVALDALVGIGPILAVTLRAEVADITRFASGAALASYAGLVPRVDASADRYRTGGITREGSPWLRWALVEAAVHAIRRDDAVGRWARRLAVRKGGMKARVGLARRLCDDIVKHWPRSA
jgi:transposase